MARLRVDTSDARSAARKVTAARFAIPTTLRRSQRQLADGAVTVYRRHAPRRTGRLSRGIRVIGGGNALTVRADAKNAETGYDYVGVTRKGHRVRVIRPRRARALKIQLAGGVIFRASAKGFRPRSDWAQDARPGVLREGQTAQRDLSRRIGALFG